MEPIEKKIQDVIPARAGVILILYGRSGRAESNSRASGGDPGGITWFASKKL
ncbi:hypothetical protein CXIVA_20000 [Clostridium sp. SY8519]|nr:hypothetical protein CXIVA_20000 [Clostridium sp. SY8519]